MSQAVKRDPCAFLASDQIFATLRDRIVTGCDNGFTRGERRSKVFGARRPDFFDHMNELRSEFLDRSELLHVHAGCVVALRRRLAVDHFLPLYLRLWREEKAFLLRELSLRWLVSACDSLADWGETPVQRALALSGSLLANSMKLVETERVRLGIGGEDIPPKPPRRPRPGMLDGMTMFRPGGDMVDNLYRRLDKVAGLDDVAGPILQEIALRVRHSDTVIRRLAGPGTEPGNG